MSKKSTNASRAGPDDAAPKRAHLPVMLAEVLEVLAPAADQLIVDGTFGAGGYTSAILDAAPCRVVAFDRDPTAVAAAAPVMEKLKSEFGAALAYASTKERMASLGIEPGSLTPEQFGPFMGAEIRRWNKVAKDANIKIEQ